MLRRLPQQLFSVLQSVQPAMAALAGFAVLGQALGAWQLVGLGLISVGNVIAVSRPGRAVSRPGRAAARPVAPPAGRPVADG